jgi:diguanylate cyclase (GGDEF)-like protein
MLRLVDLARGTTQAFDVTGGGFISGLMRARDGGLLLSADSGLYHVEWPTPWTALDRGGATGSLQGYARWGERRILLTGAGAYELTRGADGNARFEPRPWGQHPTWDLLGIDASTALLAENYALRVVDARGSREISASTLYPRVLQRSRFEPDVVFVGTELGFAVVRRDASGWRPVFVLDDVDAPNVTSLVETERGELMLGSERGGARRLRFADDWKSLREQRVFEAAEGIEYGVDRKAWLARFGALGVVASTGAGLFQWDGRRFVASDLGGLGALRTPQQTLALAEGPDGARWAWDFARIYRQAPGAGWQREDIDAVREGSLDRIVFDADGRTLFVANGSVLRHDPLARPAGIVRPMLRLTSVERVDESGARQRLPLAGSAPLRLEQGDFGINFRFATPELRRADGARYRARLVGYGEPFSDWSRSSGFTYSRLRPGAYRLELHARDARGNESEPVGFAFEILPRWYATTAALAAWTLFALGLLGFATRWAVQRRTQRLAADKQQLETMVAARTSELADANRKLDTIAHLDGLTGIPNRRKLDEYLEQVWVLCAERERPLAVLAIDVDRFKDYNDRHGHLAGDALLKRLAPILTRNLRRTEDLAARYGGEEFLVVLPGADAEVAREVAEALREKVSTSSIGATISVGVAAETPRSGREVTELVALADAALYRAKEAGRNRVGVSGA